LSYGLGVSIGLSIAARTPAVLWIGTTGVLLAFQYHAPPLKLSYRGLGELAVALCYGPLIAAGTYVVQVGHVSPLFVVATMPLGLLIAAFLWINEFPDYEADRSHGKNTLVVRLGRERAARCFVAIQAAAFALIALLPLIGFSPWVLLGLVGVIPAVTAARHLMISFDRIPALIAVQRLTLMAFVIVAVTQGIGFLIGADGVLLRN
jgi:1,4-dihydroxy-2-naphthoate octaprenyltransferase